MGLVDELRKEIYVEEQKANQKRYVGDAKEIRIHPKWYHDLMFDPKIIEALAHNTIGEIRFYGYPIYRTTDVEKWKIIF